MEAVRRRDRQDRRHALKIASTQEHVDYDIVQEETKKRQILRVRSVADFEADPHSLAAEERHHLPEHSDIYAKAVKREITEKGRQVGGYQWGMVDRPHRPASAATPA